VNAVRDRCIAELWKNKVCAIAEIVTQSTLRNE
jgi:hypothetical protein